MAAVPTALSAAADALELLASTSAEPGCLDAVNERSDHFVRTLKATHDSLQAEIDRGLDPKPSGHAIQQPRAQAQLVGLRAALMGEHLAAMQAKLDAALSRPGVGDVGIQK